MAQAQTKWRLAGPWLAIATAPAALMLGGGVAQQMASDLVFWAIAFGVGALLLLSSLQGRLGVRERKTLVELARPVLGERVARWSNTLLIAILMLGWAGFGVGVAGRSLAKLLFLPDLLAFVVWAIVLILGLWQGIHRGSLIALLSSSATLVLIGWGFFQAKTLGPVAPTAVPSGTFFMGVSLVVGYGAAFSLRCADFSLRMGKTRHVFYTALLGLCLPLFLVAAAGAWLYRLTGTWDLSLLLAHLGFPSLAHIFVVVGFLGAGLSNMHSGSLALQDLLRCPRKISLFIIGTISVMLAWLGFEQAMVVWLQFLGIVVVPLIGVMVVHYQLGVSEDRPINWPGLLAWGCGALAGLSTPSALPSALVGVLIAAIAYFTLNKLQTVRKLQKGGVVPRD